MLYTTWPGTSWPPETGMLEVIGTIARLAVLDTDCTLIVVHE